MSDIEEKPENGPNPQDAAPGRGFLTSEFLKDPLAERKDISMLSNIISRNRFDIPDDIKRECVNRLATIASKEFVDVMTREGPVPMDGPADVNAVAAIRVIGMFESMIQKDQHKLIDIEMKREAKPGGNNFYINSVGSLSAGQEPVTIEQARLQAIEAVARLTVRLSAPVVAVEPAPDAPTGLAGI
jgi:hypothetical protein